MVFTSVVICLFLDLFLVGVFLFFFFSFFCFVFVQVQSMGEKGQLCSCSYLFIFIWSFCSFFHLSGCQLGAAFDIFSILNFTLAIWSFTGLLAQHYLQEK